MYASAADHIQAHGSFITFTGGPIPFLPVFYPFFFGVIEFISRVNPIEAGAMSNRLLFAGVGFTSGWIMSRFVSDRTVFKFSKKYMLIALIAVIPVLIFDYYIWNFDWSVTVFLIEAGFIIAHRFKWIILAAIILSPALLEIYSFLWTETLFILEILIL